jgi:hypothetical protein
MRKIFTSVSEDVYKALRFRSVETDTDMKDLIAEALRRFLGLSKEGGERE